jgi:hypothetical protein
MSLSAENELIIRRKQAEMIGTITEAGYVIPAPIYFNDRGDFWNTVDPETTHDQKFLETSPIAACWIYPLLPTDADPAREGIGSDHSPLVNLTYEYYLFRSYAFTRADESDTPDLFGSKVLAAHNLFTKAWLDIKAAFQGKRNIAGLPDGVFSFAKTTSIVFPAFIENRVPCVFIPKVLGFAVRMRETVQLMEVEC